MVTNRIVEYVFFFGSLGVVAYLVWQLMAPFVSAIALAAIIVTICYPLFERVRAYIPRNNRSLAALFTTILVLLIIVVPAIILGVFIFREAASIYKFFGNESAISLTQRIADIEAIGQHFMPGFSINIVSYAQQGAEFVVSNIAVIFTSTASTIFLLFIALIATFYFFRDGHSFTKYLVEISPLSDKEDQIILSRLARSVRSVALGTVLVALIQGTLTAIGLSLFGFDRAVLWGAIAAFGALIPGVGTSIVFIPAVGYLIFQGSYFLALGVAIWAALAVGLIDNLLGPYLISRGGALHPFFILLSVLGGIALFGPIGFVLGPVILSLFRVLLELYALHVVKE